MEYNKVEAENQDGICPICGEPVDRENQRYCTSCGTELCGCDFNYMNVNCEAAYSDYTINDMATNKVVPEKPLKWFYFLIYFSLFFGAFNYFATALSYLNGYVYMGYNLDVHKLYQFYGDSLRKIDDLYAIALLCLSVWSIFTRVQLARFKRTGPMCLYILYGAQCIINVMYSIVVIGIIGSGTINYGGIIASIIMVVLNYIYFSKRAHMFCN